MKLKSLDTLQKSAGAMIAFRAAMESVNAAMAETEKLHNATPANFWGGPTKEHHRLLGQSQALAALHTVMFDLHTEVAKHAQDQINELRAKT